MEKCQASQQALDAARTTCLKHLLSPAAADSPAKPEPITNAVKSALRAPCASTGVQRALCLARRPLQLIIREWV